MPRLGRHTTEIGLLKRFQARWKRLSKGRFANTLTNGFTSSNIGDFRDDCISFFNLQLQQNHLRDTCNCQDLLDMMLLFLETKSIPGKRFRARGLVHQARWMTKALYSVKI